MLFHTTTESYKAFKFKYLCEFTNVEAKVKAMADKTIELLSDPQKTARFSAAARERARSEFDPGRTVDTYESCYLRILAKNSLLENQGSDA